jgi:hypothetical protein
MDQLQMMTAKEVAKILGYKDLEPVRQIMREEMMHMENPLRVPVRALEEYINQHMYRPRKGGAEMKTAQAKGGIPRRRGGKLQAI